MQSLVPWKTGFFGNIGSVYVLSQKGEYVTNNLPYVMYI